MTVAGPRNQTVVRYNTPCSWIHYDLNAVAPELIEAKAAILALIKTPYQRNWVDALQEIQLKREVAGTSRIEGADFTERELDIALNVMGIIGCPLTRYLSLYAEDINSTMHRLSRQSYLPVAWLLKP